MAIDLNADMGESDQPGREEQALLGVVTSASVSCGAHAGTLGGIARTLDMAAAAGVSVGAHPSYPDRRGFGRRELDIGNDALVEELERQISLLVEMATRAGTAVRYVKPHGALYNRMSHDSAVAQAVATAVRACGALPVLALAGSPALDTLREAGLEVATEAFADRAYRADGTLTGRDEPGAVLVEEARVVDQALSIAGLGQVETVGGHRVEVQARSLCVHGDTPAALRLARAVRRFLEASGIDVAPFA